MVLLQNSRTASFAPSRSLSPRGYEDKQLLQGGLPAWEQDLADRWASRAMNLNALYRPVPVPVLLHKSDLDDSLFYALYFRA